MQAVEDAQDALLERRSAHDRVVYHHEVVYARFYAAVCYVVDVRREVVARVAFGDEGAQLYVLYRHLFGAHVCVENSVQFLVGRFVVELLPRLIGAPPGYVGYDEGGQLTEAVRRNPYSIILFDEIEKAHKDIFNVLLQILDDGRITDGQGRTVDFKNTIIIMTSNLGSEYILENTSNSNELVMNELKSTFKPEFINRIDEIIVFNSLSKEVVNDILDKIISDTEDRLKDKNLHLVVTESARRYIIDSAYDEKYGARPIKRFVQRNVETLIANAIINDKIKFGSTITIDFQDNKLILK